MSNLLKDNNYQPIYFEIGYQILLLQEEDFTITLKKKPDRTALKGVLKELKDIGILSEKKGSKITFKKVQSLKDTEEADAELGAMHLEFWKATFKNREIWLGRFLSLVK